MKKIILSIALILTAVSANAAEIKIQVPDGKIARVYAGICGLYGYQEEIEGQPNPENCQQFARGIIKKYILEVVRNYEINEAIKAAAEAKDAELKADVEF